ncbi:Uma2 family endonuclease [Planktothrix sp. PCC 11201]|uniref:Uma2 family endonuclease n=1 Tax=Planktothrix sp. PCC 11201 TaxID=1729650 RepID=UPI0009A8C7B8|nr:Uma2 family endonuclease [Planktothrix sp. PCC 11201]
MIAKVAHHYSLDEYRALEEKAEGRSEYRDGEIVPMPGGSLNHSRIGRNILTYLCVVLGDTQFEQKFTVMLFLNRRSLDTPPNPTSRRDVACNVSTPGIFSKHYGYKPRSFKA